MVVEYTPTGDVTLMRSVSPVRRVRFEWYDAVFSAVTPTALPLEGGTALTVSGLNLFNFGEAYIVSEVGLPRLYDDRPLCIFGDHWLSNSSATLSECSPRIVGWSRGDDSISGCTQLVCEGPALADSPRVGLYITLNGQFDSRQWVGLLTYFDSATVIVSMHTPSAGPVSGGTAISVRGSGFRDYGAVLCILSAGSTLLKLRATVVSNSSILCTTNAEAIGIASALSLGITLNGDIASVKQAEGALARRWYFADLSVVMLTAIQPSGSPLDGGTLVVLGGSNMRVCAGAICPEPPLCIFKRSGEHLAKVVSGAFMTQSGSDAIVCHVPESGLASEAVTEVAVAAESLVVQIEIALLGHLQPEALLPFSEAFSYYDATLLAIQPQGGPSGGGTMLTISGSSLTSFAPETAMGWATSNLHDTVLCVLLPTSAHSAPIVATMPASVHTDGSLRCLTPPSPVGPGTLFVECSLNGYASQHTVHSGDAGRQAAAPAPRVQQRRQGTMARRARARLRRLACNA